MKVKLSKGPCPRFHLISAVLHQHFHVLLHLCLRPTFSTCLRPTIHTAVLNYLQFPPLLIPRTPRPLPSYGLFLRPRKPSPHSPVLCLLHHLCGVDSYSPSKASFRKYIFMETFPDPFSVRVCFIALSLSFTSTLQHTSNYFKE